MPPLKCSENSSKILYKKTVYIDFLFDCSYNIPTWDHIKRLQYLADHGIDFIGCEVIFDGPVFAYEDVRAAYGEQRICAIGWLNGVVVHLTYTERDDDFHAISLRRAEKHEIRRCIKETSR